MKVIVCDLETTVQRIVELDDETQKERHIIDNSPFNPHNRIVTAHWRLFRTDDKPTKFNTGHFIPIGNVTHSTFYHNDYPTPDSREQLQEALDEADYFVAHNAKYDITYLLEAGFTIPSTIWCTMVGEYILARGTREALSLKETAIRRDVTLKKDDLTHELFKAGTGYEAMPLALVHEYGDGDIDTCADIFIQQWYDFQDVTKTRKLKNIVLLMNEMLLFLVNIERNGVCVDLESLAIVEKEYIEERRTIQTRLQEICTEVMGDTPINLASGEDISKIIFSREVIDKHQHKDLFNLGLGFDGRPKYPPRMSEDQFTKAVRKTTKVIYRQTAFNCPECKGNKFIRKIKKDGKEYKNLNKCPTCDGLGVVYVRGDKIAGFKLSPESPRDASVNGFKCGSDEIDRLIFQARTKDNLTAVEFLTKKKRLNVINTYLNSFVKGIQRWTRSNNVLHPSFNQCVARTGRLSSSDPNFQNQPKGRKFPVRRSIVSRWRDSGGLICEFDFSGLEFVVAGELSRDTQIIADIVNGKDIHGQTASIVTQQPDPNINWKDDEHKPIRDENKPYTFAPLYGGQGVNEPEHIRRYFNEFFNIYSGHLEWQYQQMDAVMGKGFIQTPSGREYEFPNTRRIKGRKTTNATNIVNYPVQGFATGDIVPLACIRALREFTRLGLHSLIILTVHDSIVVDVYPGEQEQVATALTWAMTEINTEIKERWDYDMIFDLKCEGSIGVNWMDMKGMK